MARVFSGARPTGRQQAVKAFLRQEISKLACVKEVWAVSEGNIIDLAYIVHGDLFPAEDVVLDLMQRLRRNFPDLLFNLVILREGHAASLDEWRSRGLIFRR